MDVLKIFRSPWLCPWLIVPKLLMGFCCNRSYESPTKFEVRSFTRSWYNSGYFKTLCSPWLCPRFFFSKMFNGLLFGWTLRMYRPNLKSVALLYLLKNFRQSRSSKVVDFGTNRKRVCNFLLVRHSNLAPILHRFGDIAVFCAPESWVTPPLFHPYFGSVPVAPDGPRWDQPEKRR